MDYLQHAQPQAPHADLPTPNGKSADGGVTASLPSLLSNGQMEQVGGPVSAAWREGTLTGPRSWNLSARGLWLTTDGPAAKFSLSPFISISKRREKLLAPMR